MKPAKGKAAVNKVSKDALKTVNDRKVGKSSKPISKKGAAKKDPNKPKRPPSAFFVFLEEFRKTFKEKHPNVKGVAAVGKAGGEKWKSMSKSEKAPYEAKAAKRKTEYEKVMTAYNKKQTSRTDDADEESEKSKSEVHDDDEESGEEDDEDEEDDDDEDDD